jgi:hypothetical protein
VRTIIVGVGKISQQALAILQGSRIPKIDLFIIDTAQNKLLDFESGEKASYAHLMPSVPSTAGIDEAYPRGVTYFVVDALEDIHSELIQHYLTELHGSSVVTTVIALIPSQLSTHRQQQLKDVALQLSKLGYSLIVLCDESISDHDGRSLHIAIANVIMALNNILIQKGDNDISVDKDDLQFILKYSGIAAVGIAESDGIDRGSHAIQHAMALPYLTSRFKGAVSKLLLNITSGPTPELEMEELTAIVERIQDEFGEDVELIFGYRKDEDLDNKIRLELVAAVD